MMRSTAATSRCANRTVSHTAVEKFREVGHHPASRITRDLYIPEAVISSSLKVLASQSFHTSKSPLQRALSTQLTCEHGKLLLRESIRTTTSHGNFLPTQIPKKS